jgi:hypothetical protein
MPEADPACPRKTGTVKSPVTAKRVSTPAYSLASVVLIDRTRDDDEPGTLTPKTQVKVPKRKSGSAELDCPRQLDGPGSDPPPPKKRQKAVRRASEAPIKSEKLSPVPLVHASTPSISSRTRPPKDNSPLAIYARYTDAGNAWYAT